MWLFNLLVDVAAGRARPGSRPSRTTSGSGSLSPASSRPGGDLAGRNIAELEDLWRQAKGRNPRLRRQAP